MDYLLNDSARNEYKKALASGVLNLIINGLSSKLKEKEKLYEELYEICFKPYYKWTIF